MENGKLRLNQNNQKKEIKEKPIVAAIYARVSSNTQVNGYSLDEQVRLAREQCEKKGWEVRYIFKENGISGKTIERPKFQMLMKKAEQRAFDVIVFWKLDRFARSLFDIVNVEKQLRELGVNICSLTEAIDTTTSSGRFVFRTLASATEWERDMISERSRMGMQALAMQHKWPNRIVPLGYFKNDDGYLSINKFEAEIVKKIFQMYLKIKSMPQVAYELNKMNIKTKNGKEWTKRYIKLILDNELYIGKYNIAGVEAYIKECAIVKEKIFRKAKQLRYRYRIVNEPMPKTRKEAVVNKIFDEYFQFLNDMENNTLENMDTINSEEKWM